MKNLILFIALTFSFSWTYAQPGSTCANPFNIGAVPFNQAGMTTCGFGDDFSSLDACGSSYMNGDDFVFEYTPATNEDIGITLTNTDTWVGLFILDGCPNAGGSNCIANATEVGGN